MKEDMIIGRNPVIEAIKTGRSIDKILVRSGAPEGSLKKIIALAKSMKITVAETDRRKMDTLCEGENHQGVIAYVSAYEYASTDDILAAARAKGEAPFVVICDRITDPHNLGAVLRTARATGVHGVIIPKHESVSLNATVAKVAAGAAEVVPVARVTNLAKTIDLLKEEGLWITGADAAGDRVLWEADFDGAVGLVVGSEGTGMSRLITEKCDFLVGIPMKGGCESLNASVAASLMMYEVARRRG